MNFWADFQLDTVYLKLENATQVALESAFNDKVTDIVMIHPSMQHDVCTARKLEMIR